jgi:ketosteroid isomerase-like protein
MNCKLPGVPAACIVFVLAAGAVSAQTTASQGSSSQSAQASQATSATAEQQVRAAHQQLVEASRSADKDAARRLMADDMTWVTAAGHATTKEEMLAGTPTPPKEVSIDRVRMLGDTAIVTGSAQLADGRQVRFLQEWVNRDGDWHLFAHQGTAVIAKPEPGRPAATPPAAGTSGRTMSSSPPTLSSNDERAIWKVQSDLQQAFLRGDTAAYGSLTADDYVRITANGEQQGKSQFLETVKKNASQSKGQLETGDVQIAVTGDTARVVMTTWGTLPGGEAAPPSRVTRVFVKRNGQWQQAAAIFTPVAQQ